MERTSGNVVISGFEYTYDGLSRIAEERILAGALKACYTYDALSRVTGRTVRRLSDNSVVSSESFTYDAAGNVTGASGSTFAYDTNNRLTAFNGNPVSYDLDGNMLSDGAGSYTYDSAIFCLRNNIFSRCKVKNAAIKSFKYLAGSVFVLLIVEIAFLIITEFVDNAENVYSDYLKRMLLRVCIPLVFFELIVFLTSLFLFHRFKDSRIIEGWMMIVLFLWLIVFSLFIIGETANHYFDIKQNDPIVYLGDFEKGQTRVFVFLYDEKHTRINNTHDLIEKGVYSGMVLYSKRTKYLLKYQLTATNSY